MKDRNSKAYWNAKLKRMGLGAKLRKPPRMRPGRHVRLIGVSRPAR